MRLNEKERNTFFRCRTCGKLVGSNPKDLEKCLGHHHGNAYYVNLWEWIKIKLGILR